MTVPKSDWINLALDIKIFHEEMILEYGQAQKGYQVTDSEWSIRKTAQAFNISPSQCHNYLLLAEKLKDKNSIVKTCKTKSEALRMAKKGK